MKKLIIFDMDGLLLDTERLYQKYWFQVIKESNLDITQDQLRRIIGMGFEQTKKFFLNYLNSEDDFYDLRKRRELEFWEDIESNGMPTKEGAIEVLNYLKLKGIKTALITSTEEQRARKLLSLAKIDHVFDYMVFSNMVTKTKPDPEVYHVLLKQTEVPKTDWLVLEDSYNGLKAANNADVDVIWVRDLAEVDQNNITYLAVYNSLTEVKKHFE